jgi:hypothetical protein
MYKKDVVSRLCSFLQNRIHLIAISAMLIIILSACAASATPPSSESIFSQIQAAVTATLAAQATTSAQSATASPTATLLPTVTPLSYDTPTQVVILPTSTTWYGSYATNYGCEDSEFIKDVTIPDGTIVTPGEAFTKKWKFRNTGSCTWTSDFSIVFVNGDDMAGSDTEIDKTVYANKTADISVALTAPEDEGTYTSYWQLEDAYGNTFGDTVYVEIDVEEGTATSTPKATSTPTATYTAAPTSTALPTATSTPVITNTVAPTPTPTVVPNTPTATQTSVPTATFMPVITNTAVPTLTPTVVPDTPTAAQTMVPTATATSVPTETPTQLPTDGN